MLERQEDRGLSGSTGNGGARAILAVGIDNLATLEELFGERLGDQVMAAVGERIEAAAPPGATLERTPHRRFLLGLAGMQGDAVAALFERLQAAAVAEAIATDHGPVAVTLSGGCGMAGTERDGEIRGDAPRLARAAALQALHGAQTRCVGAFEMARDERALLEYRARLMHVSRAAINAIGDEQLAVAFQPVVRAGGGPTISFHECLVRIRQPGGGLLAAAAFMPAIERLGLAPLIDRQVLLIALRTLARHPSARLSINIFPQTMQDRRWMTLFEREAAQDPTIAERLIVEVTETSSVLEPRRTRTYMDRLRRHGVAFALDDFGAGHTSLHYLRDFRFDIIKVDGRFVRDVKHGSDNAFFVETVVNIARRFDMMTVAEAVQTHAEARCLSEIGIDSFQGFHFGTPSLALEPTPSPMPAIAARA